MTPYPVTKPTKPPTTIDTYVSASELGITVAIYGALGLVCIGIYCLIRRYAKRFYTARSQIVRTEKVAPDAGKGYFDWVPPLFSSETDRLVLRYAGVDAYVAVRFLGLGCKLFLVLGVSGMIILGSVYGTQGSSANFAASHTNHTALDKLTISYITKPSGNDNPLFWLPCVFVYLFTLVGLYLVREEYKHIVPVQREYHLYSDNSAYTILVEYIPEQISSRKALYRYFESIFPQSIERIEVMPFGPKASELKDAIEDRESILFKLERAMLEQHKKDLKNKLKNPDVSDSDRCEGDDDQVVDEIKTIAFSEPNSILSSRLCCYGHLCHLVGQGEKVGAVKYYQECLQGANAKVEKLQAEVRGSIYDEADEAYPYQVEEGEDANDSGEEWTFSMDKFKETEWLLDDHAKGAHFMPYSAFVTFKDKMSSAAAGRAMSSDVKQIKTQFAPEPWDLEWGRLSITAAYKIVLRTLIIVVNVALLILFGVLTSTISVSTNIPAMRGWAALNDFLNKYPWTVDVFAQIAPLLLVIAFALVPPVLTLILQGRREISESATERSLFSNYYVFLVIQMFIFYQLSGAIYQIAFEAFNNPRVIVDILADTIPSNAVFFMQFMSIRLFWGLPAELLRVSSAAVACLVRPIFYGRSKTPRDIRKNFCGCRTFMYAADAWYGYVCAQWMLVFTIGVTYSVMSPLVLVFSGLYFGGALLVYRNQLLYVYVKNYESGGRLWRPLSICMIFSFFLMQMTMLGYFAINSAITVSILMLPPMVATISYGVFLITKYGDMSEHITLADARRFDLQNLVAASKQEKLDYTHPSLKAKAHEEPQSVTAMMEWLERRKMSRDTTTGNPTLAAQESYTTVDAIENALLGDNRFQDQRDSQTFTG
mmetsp:Transcript_15301/g.24890  ORF Transcript_15301/g.24890 Transcript_15301/m.24890 type:complete len:879 (-) Transcript_15301:772-3408(-)